MTGTSSRSLAATSGSKFRNQPEYVDGHRFDSKAEANRYRELALLERAGAIRDLKLQPRFPFEVNGKPVLIKSDGYPNGRRASYRGDFRYTCNETNRDVVEDVKGHDTSESRLRRALVECIYGVEIVLIRSQKRAKRARFNPKRRRK